MLEREGELEAAMLTGLSSTAVGPGFARGRIRLRDGSRLQVSKRKAGLIEWGSMRCVVKNRAELDGGLVEALFDGGIEVHCLRENALNREEVNLLSRLAARGLLVCTMHGAAQPLASLLPLWRPWRLVANAILLDQAYVLSRFVQIRREDGRLIAESPRSNVQIILHDRRVTLLLHALRKATALSELAVRNPLLTPAEVSSLLNMLLSACMVGATGPSSEDNDPSLRTWEFHDLLFYARSRALMGGPTCERGQPADAPSAPARLCADAPPLRSGAAEIEGGELRLQYPDPLKMDREDAPFARIQDMRSSIRSYGSPPINVTQLAEFLYRVGRVMTHPVLFPQRRADVVASPEPAGTNRLRLYVVSNECKDLNPAIYRYDAVAHSLGLVCERTIEVEQLLALAKRSTGIADQQVQVLLIVTACFPSVLEARLNDYTHLLMQVGALFQIMYLSAAMMQLAPCALGGGDSDLFARATGTNYYVETSVGEFLLGSKPCLLH